jgi:hypothetical protein
MTLVLWLHVSYWNFSFLLMLLMYIITNSEKKRLACKIFIVLSGSWLFCFCLLDVEECLHFLFSAPLNDFSLLLYEH